ncbi:TetR family transcriptional regulator [Sphingomonas sp. H39-1-10]|uniref:TetR/AcrR family transcriptional regulator n=1 Tax=Sphingomonas TaxID=13687 RepID=UPI0008808E4D|nr:MULTISPECIES: TetR/AcrR family transcriptional regulator [Sphingomonas]MDF0489934.1 TetR family transcriptional regulator [Sphingomonas pollutisoli]SDA36948.1 transcriptional regulator, TetR family [Sphingomonas sp. NFR15]
MIDSPSTPPLPGTRERKRRETHRRIADAGVSLFIEKGFDGTTVEEIATAAGISRRTFFHYFDSKDDILLSLQSDIGGLFAAEIRKAPAGGSPFMLVRDAALSVCASISHDDMLALDRLMRGSASVRARKQASYRLQEEALFAALCERWPEPERETRLRVLAMIAVGTTRLASETFNQEGGTRPFDVVLRDAFDAVATEFSAFPPSSGA